MPFKFVSPFKPDDRFLIISHSYCRKDRALFQIANGEDRRHVMCVGSRSGSNPGSLGSEPSALTNCASCPLAQLVLMLPHTPRTLHFVLTPCPCPLLFLFTFSSPAPGSSLCSFVLCLPIPFHKAVSDIGVFCLCLRLQIPPCQVRPPHPWALLQVALNCRPSLSKKIVDLLSNSWMNNASER
jgi:hypothetical protein